MKDTIPTRYKDLETVKLHQLFSSGKWEYLTPDEKLDACQEVANRYAVENNTWACRVKVADMDGSAYGEEFRGCIVLNGHLVNDGQFISKDVDAGGNIVDKPVDVPAANWQVLETVYHEATHGIQEAKGTLNHTYFDSATDYNLYRIQGNEKEAFANGQFRTLEAIDSVQKMTGEKDVNAEAYYQSVKQESFQSSLDEAIRDYNDPNIENTLNRFINDRDKGLVNSNPGESYLAVEQTYNDQFYAVSKTSGPAEDHGIDHGGMSGDSFDPAQYDDGAQLDLTAGYDLPEDDGATLDDTVSEDHSGAYTGGLSQDNGMEM